MVQRLVPTDIDGNGALAALADQLEAATEVELDFLNSGNDEVIIENGSAAPVTATINGIVDENGRSADVELAIAAGGHGISGFLPTNLYGSPCTITLTAFADVNVGVRRIKKSN